MRKYILCLMFVLIPLPAYAIGITELLSKTVAPDQPGFVILEIIGVAITSWIAEMICSILGKQNLANSVKILTAFVGTLLVLVTGLNIIRKMLDIF